MTRRTNARVAGVTFLFYIAVALTSMMLDTRSTSGDTILARLTTLAQHTTEARLGIVFGLLSGLSAVVLAVTLRAITRDQDPDIATVGFAFRLGEGLMGFLPIPTLGLLWLAANRPEGTLAPVAVDSIGMFLLQLGNWQVTIASLLFAIGSTAFAWLLLRGRIVPAWIAWPGLAGSALIAAALVARMVGIGGVWLPVLWGVLLVYEVALAIWLIVKGAAMPAKRQPELSGGLEGH